MLSYVGTALHVLVTRYLRVKVFLCIFCYGMHACAWASLYSNSSFKKERGEEYTNDSSSFKLPPSLSTFTRPPHTSILTFFWSKELEKRRMKHTHLLTQKFSFRVRPT